MMFKFTSMSKKLLARQKRVFGLVFEKKFQNHKFSDYEYQFSLLMTGEI